MSLRTTINMLVSTPSTWRVVSTAAIGSLAITTLSLHAVASSAQSSAISNIFSPPTSADKSVYTKSYSEDSKSPRLDTPSLKSKISSVFESVKNDDEATVSVKVNGKDVDVPENGSLHRVIERDGTRTVVDVQTNQAGHASTFSHTTTTSSVTTSTGVNGTSIIVHSSN
jgi:hypothetical protein